MKTKIQIKSIWGSLLFEYESENNSIKKTLEKAYLSGANLSGSDLSGSDLSRVDLSGVDLSGAYLSGANLSGSDLSGSDLSGANLKLAQSITRICPEEGAFVGYKKASGCVVKVEIPAEAKRHNVIGGRKCRAEFVKVLEIRNEKGHKVKEVSGDWNHSTVYKVGEMVYPDSYNPDPRIECSNGIHFFISRDEAKEW
jgi:hypothetical protein